jgi:hypothetical protein
MLQLDKHEQNFRWRSLCETGGFNGDLPTNLMSGSITGNLYRQLDVPKKLSRLGMVVGQVSFIPACV